MRKILFSVIIVIMFCSILLIGSSSPILAEETETGNNLAPNSPFYFLDRFIENVSLTFMSTREKVSFYFDLAAERFQEAKEMFAEDESEKAYELLKEGFKNISEALKNWGETIKDDIDDSKLKERFGEVIDSGKETFNEIKENIDFSKIVEITKEIAILTKEQLKLFLQLDDE